MTSTAWSHDGTKLALVRFEGLAPGEIWVMDADGQHQALLTNNTAEDAHPGWR